MYPFPETAVAHPAVRRQALTKLENASLFLVCEICSLSIVITGMRAIVMELSARRLMIILAAICSVTIKTI